MTSYKEVYEKGILDIWLDISTFCNAACPACHRTERLKPGLGKVNWLPLIQWSIDEFKSVYNKEMIERTRRWEFCGTFGDPAMNKDLVKMTKYILDNNNNSEVIIFSNGSIRSKEWWYDLGKLGKSVSVWFALEGITQEMHAKYRRKTSLKKLLENMQAFTNGGGATKSFTVIHRHNQDYLHKIENLALEHGAEGFAWVKSTRYDEGEDSFSFYDEYGNMEKLYKPTKEFAKPFHGEVV